MTFTVSMRVRIDGKNVVIRKTSDKDDHGTAIREVAEQAHQMRKSAEVKKKSVSQGYRKKKPTQST